MILPERRIEALIQFGESIALKLGNTGLLTDEVLNSTIIKARIENPWFTEKSIRLALSNWAEALKAEEIRKWTEPYLSKIPVQKNYNVAVINAGNIPFVGLHDLLSVLLCGFNYTAKNASGDTILLPYLVSVLCEVEPLFAGQIRFVPRLENMDVVIATGNNNSARYFEYYFGKYPHVIRKNRNGAGVLKGNETKAELHALGDDIFSYFGLGCRNVSKLYVPTGYDFSKFFEAIEDFKELSFHNKYMNNFDYNNSVFLLKQIPFLQNGFLIVRKENQIASPVSVLHYEEYDNSESLIENLKENLDQLQCIAASEKFNFGLKELDDIRVEFGKTQSPKLWDYADGVDTVKFLCEI